MRERTSSGDLLKPSASASRISRSPFFIFCTLTIFLLHGKSQKIALDRQAG